LLVSLDLLLDLEQLQVVLLQLLVVRLQQGIPCDELLTLARGTLELNLKHLNDLPQLLSINEALLVLLLISLVIVAL
jgi:hypothetical protein